MGPESGRILWRARHQRAFEDLLLPLRIERKELRLLLNGTRASTAVIASATENQTALWFPRQRNDALVCDEVPIILDGFVLSRIPNGHRAAEFTIGRLAADVDESGGPTNHRSRTQVPITDATEGNRITVCADAKFPERLRRIIEIHHRTAVIAEIQLPLMFEQRINLPARHCPEMLGAS